MAPPSSAPNPPLPTIEASFGVINRKLMNRQFFKFYILRKILIL
jgi:hypothetical protein